MKETCALLYLEKSYIPNQSTICVLILMFPVQKNWMIFPLHMKSKICDSLKFVSYIYIFQLYLLLDIPRDSIP